MLSASNNGKSHLVTEPVSISRRAFAGLGAAAAALGSAAVLPASADEQAEAGAASDGKQVANGLGLGAETAVATGDGKYVTRAMGHESWIYVATTFTDGAISDCRVLAHSETIGIGSYACERIPQEIVAAQSFNVAPVRGCSMSSNAIMSAVRQAVELSGYNVGSFDKPVEYAREESEETLDVDVVVVGAGTAGLVAAARLLDRGLSVAIIEKRAIPGGSMAMTYSGMPVAGTPDIAAYNIDGSVAARYVDEEGEDAHWASFVDPQYDRYDGAIPFMSTAYAACNSIAEWFKGIGIGFNTLGSFEGGVKTGVTHYLAPGCYMGGSGYAMMALARRCEILGDVRYLTACTGLIQDDPGGRVRGVTAVGLNPDDTEDGRKLTVNARATLITTGGFAANKDMLAEHYPDVAEYFWNCASASTGEGLRMVVDAGSKIECEGRHLPGFLSSASYFELAFLNYSTPGFLVNTHGDNCGDIDGTGAAAGHSFMSDCLTNPDNGGRFFYVFDEAGAVQTKDYETYGFTTYAAMFERGEVYHYDSVEDAAEDLDLPGLPAAFEANNKAALAGVPDEFGRLHCPYLEPRYGVYLMPVMPTLYLTSCGACIDPQGHVLADSYQMGDGAENVEIPGLYAAGDVCGSVEEKDGKNYSMGFDNAMGIGYSAAETIASELA